MSTQTNPPHYRGEQVGSRDRVERKLPQQHHSASWPNSDQPLPEFLNGSRRRADRPIIPPSAPQLPEAPVEAIPESTLAPQEVPGLSPLELQELEREIMRQQQARPRRSLAPEFMPPPPPPARPQARIVSGDSMGGLVMRLSLIVTVVVIGLLMFAGKISLPASWKTTALEPLKRLGALASNSSTTPQAPPAPLQPVVTEAPRLVIEAADAGTEDEIGLGVKIQGPIEGVTAIVSGIAAGTTLSRGRPWGETGWFVPAAELGMTKLRPPAGFSGTMQYTVSLKMPDSKIADRQTLRLQWSEAQSAKESLRKLDPDEIATLLKRGQALFETGDLAGARLLLQRAAEAGDPVAAMAIASTYDPVTLQDLGVRGFVADVGKARYWYEKAREFGSKEAPRRLESLASQGR